MKEGKGGGVRGQKGQERQRQSGEKGAAKGCQRRSRNDDEKGNRYDGMRVGGLWDACAMGGKGREGGKRVARCACG